MDRQVDSLGEKKTKPIKKKMNFPILFISVNNNSDEDDDERISHLTILIIIIKSNLINDENEHFRDIIE